MHIESLKEIIKNNPKAIVITNEGVGKLLDESGIEYEILENKIPKEFMGIELEAHDCKHEEILKSWDKLKYRIFYRKKTILSW